MEHPWLSNKHEIFESRFGKHSDLVQCGAVAVDSQQFAMLLRLSCVKQAIHVLDA
jgi:hypothetical protein